MKIFRHILKYLPKIYTERKALLCGVTTKISFTALLFFLLYRSNHLTYMYSKFLNMKSSLDLWVTWIFETNVLMPQVGNCFDISEYWSHKYAVIDYKASKSLISSVKGQHTVINGVSVHSYVVYWVYFALFDGNTVIICSL